MSSCPLDMHAGFSRRYAPQNDGIFLNFSHSYKNQSGITVNTFSFFFNIYFLDSASLTFLFVSILGTIIGSFSLCMVQRLISHDSLLRNSHCEACACPLRTHQLIPILSYLVQKGRCPSCQTPISWHHPLSELLVMVLALVGLWRWGLTPDFFWYLALLPFLAIVLFSDLLIQKIPDGVSIAIGVLGLAKIVVTHNPICLLSPLIAVSGVWSLQKIIEKAHHRIVLGVGDLILIGATSLWMAPLHLPYYSIAMGGLGVIVSFMYHRIAQKSTFPFAPAILFGMIMVWMILGETP